MVRSTRPLLAPESSAVVLPTVDPGDISAQALHLHALGLMTTALANRDGVLGRREAERLAERCGALTSELVDVGLWLETDVSFVVLAGALLRDGAEPARRIDPSA